MPARDRKKSPKVEQAPPPCPDEWRTSLKGTAVFAPPGPNTAAMFIGSRYSGRAMASPYNWPATNATSVHARTGSEWELGGALYNYSRGISTS
mmetsp:Transcript_140543/g.350351  ORF Transcript_140543/g.350351 Transcript_140543/m.350351 type:complete len:93 (-) Transcript_140543:66-344(-)